MKHWTQREATTGGTISPGAVNDELRAQQSSITTLDRDQLPGNYVSSDRLKDYALTRVYSAEELFQFQLPVNVLVILIAKRIIRPAPK